MRYQWRFPDDVCGNGDDTWVHALVVVFTLMHAAKAQRSRAIPLLLFALLEATHGYAHQVAAGPSGYADFVKVWILGAVWAVIHYTVIVCAYSIKPLHLKWFVPFLCIDLIGHLIGNDMLSIATTMSFAATRFDSVGMQVALAMTFTTFAFIELVACEWSNGHLHEAWDMGLAVAMMAGVRWFALKV
jgi:hypothetical protein